MPQWISLGTLLLKIAAVSTLRDCNQEGCGREQRVSGCWMIWQCY